MNCRACLLAAPPSLAGSAAMADPIAILFVGNSYTFGRVDPVLSYNAANVHDGGAAAGDLGAVRRQSAVGRSVGGPSPRLTRAALATAC
jgi:hypothetical protein